MNFFIGMGALRGAAVSLRGYYRVQLTSLRECCRGATEICVSLRRWYIAVTKIYAWC